jgi:hypothetical protein
MYPLNFEIFGFDGAELLLFFDVTRLNLDNLYFVLDPLISVPSSNALFPSSQSMASASPKNEEERGSASTN